MEERKRSHLKPILWIGSSKKDLKEMPEDVQSDIGHSLRDVQKGKDPGNVKILRHLGANGIWEVRTDDVGGTFRAVYTVKFAEAIAVLHVFHKKSKRGIETSKQDLDLILARLKKAEEVYAEWQLEEMI